MNKGGRLGAIMMVAEEVEDLEDLEDTVPMRGLSIVLSSSAKWRKLSVSHGWSWAQLA
jgi:hypothetical protein